MNNYLDYICCTYCKSELSEGTNTLKCTSCGKEYQVREGIPIMVDLGNLPEHLRGQVEYFEKEDVTETDDYRLDEWQKSYVERFFENFHNVENKFVIDEGTGSGYMAFELAKRGAVVLALDLTLKSLIRLKKIYEGSNASGKILFVCCTAESLPIKSQIADYFISNAVLEHLPKELEAIAEINRVCKPVSGSMITVPLLMKYLHPLLVPLNIFHDKRIGHLRRYDADVIMHKFPSWTPLKFYYTGHFNKVMKTVLNMAGRFFSEESIEQEDKRTQNNPKGASNIIAFLDRHEK